MWEQNQEFWSNWLDITERNITLPIPFTNGATIEIVDLLSFVTIGLIVGFSIWLVCYVFKAILTAFRGR